MLVVYCSTVAWGSLTWPQVGDFEVAIGGIEIADDYWPYERADSATEDPELRAYVDRIREILGERACVRNPLSAADELLARDWHARGVPAERIVVTGSMKDLGLRSYLAVPILYEDEVLGVIEFGSLQPFPEIHQEFLREMVETIGVVLNTIRANMRTEELLDESRRLTSELQNQSHDLQQQQDDLRRANEELQEKAQLLAEQKRSVELKKGETVVFAYIVYRSRAQRDRVNAKVMKDPRLASMMDPKAMPFDA